jgi:hypothetical protein
LGSSEPRCLCPYNPAAFARTYIWWLREDDAEAVIVDRDIKDELEADEVSA